MSGYVKFPVINILRIFLRILLFAFWKNNERKDKFENEFRMPRKL